MVLDNFRKINITLNKANQQILDPQIAKVGDVNGRELVVQIVDEGVVKDQSGVTLKLNWQHANGNQGSKTFGALDAKQGIFSVYYPENMLFRGTVTANISINESGKITNSLNFQINVQGDVFDGSAVEVDGILFTLKDLKNQLDERDDNLESLENRQNTVENQFDALQQEITDKDVISSPEIIAARGSEKTLGARLDRTKPIKYLTDVPNITDLNEGELGVLVKDEVKLAVTSVYPSNNATDVEIDTPIFIDFNMAIDLETVDSRYIRLMEGTTLVNLLLGVDHFKNRIVAYPVLTGQRLKPNTKYTLEITDGVRSVNGHSIGANTIYRSKFTTGTTDSILLNSTISDYASAFDTTTIAPANVTKLTNRIVIDTRDGGSFQLKHKLEDINNPATIDYLLKISTTNSVQFRMVSNMNSYVLGFMGSNRTQDIRDANVVNKHRPYSVNQYIHVRLAVDENGFCVVWVNGDRLDDFKYSRTGDKLLFVQNTPGLVELHRIKIWNSFKELG